MLRVVFTVVAFISASFSAPLDCKKLTQHLDPFDQLQHISGKWAMVAGSVKRGSHDLLPLETTKSISLELGNSSFTQFIRSDPGCWSITSNFTLGSHFMKTVIGDSKQIVIFLQTSCQDCRLFTVDVISSEFPSQGIYLFSKNRHLKHDEIAEFKSQAACLNFPAVVEMNPDENLC